MVRQAKGLYITLMRTAGTAYLPSLSISITATLIGGVLGREEPPGGGRGDGGMPATAGQTAEEADSAPSKRRRRQPVEATFDVAEQPDWHHLTTRIHR